MMTATRKKSVTPAKSGTFKVGFHSGNVIMYLANLYNEVIQVILDVVQNQLDKNATACVVELDLKKRKLVAWDNGEGASKTELRKRVRKIGAHQKTKDQIGNFGVGNLAPLAIAQLYRLITSPGDNKFFELIFDRRGLEESEEVEFVWKDKPAGFAFEQGRAVSTMVLVQQIEPSALRSLRRLDEPSIVVAEAIADTFSAKMISQGVKITVKVIGQDKIPCSTIVKPRQFPGDQETVTIKTKSGKVEFEMYKTLIPQKNPQIMVEHQGLFSFPLSNMSDIWMGVQDTLGSGHLQGIIRLDFCTPNPNRTGFEWKNDLDHFITAVETFAEKYARPMIKKVRQHNQFERFGKIADEAIAAAEILLRSNPHLRPKLLGLVSPGHKQAKGAKPAAGKFKSTRKPGPTDDTPRLQDPQKPGGEKKIAHDSVERPDGYTRKVVRGQSGLTIAFREPDDALGYDWRVKVGIKGGDKGKILINIHHKDFSQAQDRGDKHLGLYLRMLLIRVMVSSRLSGDQNAIFIQLFEEEVLQFKDFLMPKTALKPLRKAK